MTAENISDLQNAYRFRRVLSQILATTVKLMLIFQLGLCMSFSSIVIAALTGISNEHNNNETLTLTGIQASWIGSVVFICEPIGSLLSAVTTDYLGRRRAMMLVNIPFAIGWLTLYKASSVGEIFIANSLLGLSLGLMEAPTVTYIGEICEPVTRGILVAYTNLGTPMGGFFVFSLNTMMGWRSVALICMSVPILTIVALCFIPETPHWLLSKNRVEEAERALCWLRGWVPKEVVADEFHQIRQFRERSKTCNICIAKHQKCTHSSQRFTEKLAEFKQKRTFKTLFIVISLFAILQFSGLFAMTPYLVQIFKAYKSPLPPDVATAILSFLNVFATITFMSLEHFIGKRRIYLTALSGVCISSFVISCYGFVLLPSGFNSFDKSQAVPALENEAIVYIPTIFLIIWSFCSYCGILMMPWQMLAEIFAFKTRGLATGLSAAINYIMASITIKSYYNLETSLSIAGVSMFYCCIATLGLILMYNILPETENRSLEDIETHFSDDSKKITDWQIPKYEKKQKIFKNGVVETSA